MLCSPHIVALCSLSSCACVVSLLHGEFSVENTENIAGTTKRSQNKHNITMTQFCEKQRDSTFLTTASVDQYFTLNKTLVINRMAYAPPKS